MQATDNTQDMLDVRDLIERIEELEAELGPDTAKALGSTPEGWDGKGAEERSALILKRSEALNDGLWKEYADLSRFMHELAGNGGDERWRGAWYPVTCVRESYWKEYTQQFAEDIGAIGQDAAWPYTCIDWDQAAKELRMDYTCAEYGGVTYWFR